MTKHEYDRRRYLRLREEKLARQKIYDKTDHGREVNRRASLKYGNPTDVTKLHYEKLKSDSKAYAEHLRKHRAQNTVHYALKTGKLVKGKCEVCGSLDTHAHHDDYENKLAVRWLCPLHHGIIRRIEEAA